MNTENPLDALRREIDAIDESLHDLIMRRTQVVERVREQKKDEKVKIRPAREAEILNRLVARHRGPFPKRELIRIWRELIVATLSFEGPFSVAVWVPDQRNGDDPGFSALARDQYGSFTPMTAHASSRRIVEMVTTGEATLGVLPLPDQTDPDPWWPRLVTVDEGAPKVIARLPVTGPGNGPTGMLEALVICPVAAEPSGRDHSYLAIETEEAIGRDFLSTALAEAGFPVRFIGTRQDADMGAPGDGPGGNLYLAEVEGFIADGTPAMATLVDALAGPVIRIIGLGTFAQPFSADELDADSGP